MPLAVLLELGRRARSTIAGPPRAREWWPPSGAGFCALAVCAVADDASLRVFCHWPFAMPRRVEQRILDIAVAN
eukprot:85438-Pyramimonas_sp.AAC.1